MIMYALSSQTDGIGHATLTENLQASLQQCEKRLLVRNICLRSMRMMYV